MNRRRLFGYLSHAGMFAALMVGGVALLNAVDSTSRVMTPTETVIRFERVIEGQVVQCTRRDDHVRHTVETAC